MRLLTGDIGGTNARLVLYEAPDDYEDLRDVKRIPSHRVVSQMYYKNNDFHSFTEILCEFLALPSNDNCKIHSCCLAVAGPVANNQINFTNREGWILDGNSMQEQFNIDSVVLINDFVANGYGLLSLSKQELLTLQEGKNDTADADTAPIALIGAGTGLGECFLTRSSDGDIKVYPTEGGHVEFAPRTNLESGLLSFMHSRQNIHYGAIKSNETDLLPRVSVERVVSGKGLENIYEFLRERYPDEVNQTLDAAYDESNERGRLIGAEKYNYKLFKQAFEIMFAIYGGEAGNVALKYLPYGGVYIAGGIAPKNIEFITNQESEFLPRFLGKGRMSSIMSDFPVHVVMKEDLGLRGAHTVASRQAARLVGTTSEAAKGGEPMEKKSSEAGLSFGAAVREAVTAYPATYAVVASATSALAAATCLASLLVLRKMNKI